ncbi:hypothetical protein CRE_25154 [Caenorhabditis remanei]|uniref:DNA2/NAM7 helicase-like C-terminal domain-containing protein n=2 Tax=Caenorhabditis remanei TaxID=31234 RepID=E3LT81_CAERE|nr:hypothetical protein CRE_25154 [Caenorhabditis remanei]
MPHRKCHRLANSFKAASSTSSQLLTDIAKLTSEDVANYLPYSPTPHVVTAKLLDPLHVCLQSPTRSIAMHALKALRSAKRQSGSSNFQDCRLIDTSVSGWQLAENGSLYLEVSVTAAISPAVFGVGTIVKLLAILNEPVIGKIVKLFVTNDVKTLTILINKTCGMNEEVSDEFEDNMEEKMSIEWKALVRIVTETGKCIPMLKLDFKNTFDTLMSGEKRLVRTELGDYLMKGLVDTSHSMYYGFPSPNLKPRVPSERLYGSDTSTSETLSTYQIVPFTRCLNRNPSHEELVFYQAILDPNIMVHLHESPVGSGKTTVLAAAVKARLMVQKSCRVALTAMTNSAVVALLTVFEFPTLFTSKDVSKEDVRPLVVQAKNWKTANGIPTHPFDWKEIIKKCFSHQLQNFDMTTVSDEAYSTNIKSMFVYLRNNTIIALAALLGKEKYDYLSKLKCRELNKKELVKYFFDSYKPNLLFSTMDSLVNFTTYLPADCMPSLIAIDESTMIQPSDLTLFASKMQSMSFESIEFVLVGDHKQLNPYNSVASLSPLTVSPNVMLMNYDAMVTRFTVVHRCHPDATELISKVFYGGFLVSGKDIQQTYIQHNLTGITFRKPKVKAYSYVPNATSSAAVAQSRCNSSEAHFVVEYAKKLIYLNGIKPSQISVITPYTAQAELLEKLLPQGIICSTCRRYQGLENDIVLLSCCHTGGKLETHHNVGMEGDLFLEGFQVQATENGKSNFKLIDDDSLILVSLTRSKHFTTIFGNDQFLRSIPRWKSILELILA